MRRCFFAIFSLVPIAAWAEVDYRLSLDIPAKSVRVNIQADVEIGESAFTIPAWCPGFYVIKNYRQKVFDVRLRDDAGKLIPTQESSGTWRFRAQSKGRVSFSYRILADDAGLGFFGASVLERTAFVNGPSTFMYLDERKGESCRLHIEAPEGWPIATSMPLINGAYVSSNYDELIDHPIQLGAMARKSFKVGDIPFEVVLASRTGRYPDIDKLVAKLCAGSTQAVRLFGSAPFKRYVYLIHLGVGDFDGGLEHRASTTIAVEYADPLELGTLALHEFFHAWNVKQIRPKPLGPFDYTKPTRTRNLWWAEGVTDYYAHLLSVPAGDWSANELLWSLGAQIHELQNSRTRSTHTLEEVCWNTWESGGFSFGDLSYYTKGLVVGLILDAAILNSTNGERSLDDVARSLYSAHRLPNPGFEEDGLRKAINLVAGKDIGWLYDLCVRSTSELPYDQLEAIGLEVVRQESFGIETNTASWPEAGPRGSPRPVGSGFSLRRKIDADERAKRLFDLWLDRNLAD